MNDHETQMLNFLLKHRRDRARYLLQKKRDKFTRLLDHPRIFEPRYLHRVEPRLRTPEAIAAQLRLKSKNMAGYLISSNPDLDQKTIPIQKALERVIGWGSGTFLSVAPGKLGYLETEDTGERFLVF